MIGTPPMMVMMSLLKMRKGQLVKLPLQIKLSFLCNMDNVGIFDQNPLARLGLIMHEIIEKCKRG
jgi:hypothetical protein